MSSEEARAAEAGAAIIHDAFRSYRDRFRDITRQARRNFETRDWHAGQRDSVRRLDLYGEAVAEALEALGPVLRERMHRREAWPLVRAAYAERIWGSADADLAETFYNSLTRRMFHTVGVDPMVEFVAASPERRAPADPGSVSLTFRNQTSLAALLRGVLEHYRAAVDYDDLERD